MGREKKNYTIEGIQDWGDIVFWESTAIIRADKNISAGGMDGFEGSINKAVLNAKIRAPKDTSLLESTIRGKYKTKGWNRIEFYLLAGGQGGVKDYYNSAFQKNQTGKYMRSANKVDKNSSRLHIYPKIQEVKHHYLELSMDEAKYNLKRAFVIAYKKALQDASKGKVS